MTFVETLASEATRYVIVIVMVAGLYTIIARGNLIKKLVGLSLFQSSVYLLYLLPAKIFGGTAPILDDRFEVYSNPLPHVLILTAIAHQSIRGHRYHARLLEEAQAAQENSMENGSSPYPTSAESYQKVTIQGGAG